LSHVKKNYGEAVVTDRGLRIKPEQVKKIAAVGSIVIVRGGSLFHEARQQPQSENF